ncbi:hypothetical protein D9M71_745910 [compost metagenome]
MDIHLFHTPLVDEVVDVGGTPSNRHRVIDRLDRNLQCPRLLIINGHLVLSLISEPVRPDDGQRRLFGHPLEQLITRLHQRSMASSTVVLEEKIKARRVTHFHDGRGDD